MGILTAKAVAATRAQIAKMRTESLTITHNVGNSAFGPIDAGNVVEKWYLEPTTKRVANDKGEEVVASLFGIGPYDSVATVGDKVTWGASTYRVIKADALRPCGEVTHVEAYFQGVA